MRNYCKHCRLYFDDDRVLRRGRCPDRGDRLTDRSVGSDPDPDGILDDMFPDGEDDGFSPSTFFDR